jgi:hypothetical protein
VEQRDDLQHPVAGEAGEVLPDEDPGGEHRLAAQHGVGAVTADEDARELGGGLVPQVAEVLEGLPVQPLGLVHDDGARLTCESGLEQVVELAGVAGWFTGQVERGEQFAAHRAGGGTGAESDPAHLLTGDLQFAQGTR